MEDKIVYVDNDGLIYSSAKAAIESNQGKESATSRGASGGCTQNSENVPDAPSK